MVSVLVLLASRYIDMAESLCQKRALEAFNLDPEKWGGKILCSLLLFLVILPCHVLSSCTNDFGEYFCIN